MDSEKSNTRDVPLLNMFMILKIKYNSEYALLELRQIVLYRLKINKGIKVYQ